MDEFEMRAREFVAKRLSSEVGSANSLPIAIAAVAIDAANWARAEMQAENERLKAELAQVRELRHESLDREGTLFAEKGELKLLAVSDRAKIAKLEKDCNCYAQALAVALRDGIFTAKDRTKSDIEQIFARAALKDGGET